MNVLLCECAEKRAFTAGNKARTDTVQILLKDGYKHIPLFVSKSKKMKILLDMCVGTVKAIHAAGKDDSIFIQYPYYPEFVNRMLVKALSFGRVFKNYKIEMLIHDVVGLRTVETDGKSLDNEVKLFNQVDRVICHNETMKRIFQEKGCTSECVVLGPFDYLYDGKTVQMKYNEMPTVIVAGNLAREKCGYVYQLSDIHNCKFALYGINYTGDSSESVEYRGSFPPDTLIEHMNGDFGLVWDGENIEECTGMYGNYLKYNNPHKFSLYIAAGLPLIVWSKSALAFYVKKYSLGICVDSLKELEKLSIEKKEYLTMHDNVMKYRYEIVRGKHLLRAINEVSA